MTSSGFLVSAGGGRFRAPELPCSLPPPTPATRSVLLSTAPTGDHVPRHVHDTVDESFYILDGQYRIHLSRHGLLWPATSSSYPAASRTARLVLALRRCRDRPTRAWQAAGVNSLDRVRLRLDRVRAAVGAIDPAFLEHPSAAVRAARPVARVLGDAEDRDAQPRLSEAERAGRHAGDRERLQQAAQEL